VVEKYANDITFLVSTNECLIEVFEPRALRIVPLGYEFDEQTIEGLIEIFLSSPRDPSLPRHETFDKKSTKI
jgi:hypothetical protein